MKKKKNKKGRRLKEEIRWKKNKKKMSFYIKKKILDSIIKKEGLLSKMFSIWNKREKNYRMKIYLKILFWTRKITCKNRLLIIIMIKTIMII